MLFPKTYLILVAPWSVALAAIGKFYYETNCWGDYEQFDAGKFDYCFLLRNGIAKSLYVEGMPRGSDVVAFGQTPDSACGYELCIFRLGPSHCCSPGKDIRGAALYSTDRGPKNLHHEGGGPAADTAAQEPGTGPEHGVDQTREVFILLADGTYFGLGKDRKGKMTSVELQMELQANGRPRLTEERLGELRGNELIK
ncbi:hypothetical protein CCM_07953 [Cordyceps militaris CM01]|uniref:Uncharacterized protein n=1 Tax=Cordyceps militaris (strain CM01) TaxID=983644 RepID=G3JP91_CORMM|nr:uncharacterized protein CCM_07953 [Cordyceps militaris CM01]EGX89701.1 hypothetical protein CCM_07953 [Cordyceps militaris CM01]